MARVELLIWWTSDAETQQIGPKAPACLPDYVRAQYELRLGRSGRGRLWVEERFGPQAIGNWPKTLIADVAQDSAGIVFSKRDVKAFAGVTGMVTDFQLRMMIP